jgi:hypothetical protein
MSNPTTQEIVQAYYNACVRMDIDQLRDIVSESLVFRSPQHRLHGVESFIAECVPFMQGLKGVRYLRSVAQDDEMFSILEWETSGGSTFVDAELVRVERDRIAEVLIINNDPMFWPGLHGEKAIAHGTS